MAAKTTLNAKNLEALGAQRLAELLIDITKGNAQAKRQLRMVLVGTHSPNEIACEITKRLSAIARARTVINWQNRKPLITDLDMQRRAIKEQVAPHDPDGALILSWRFMGLANSIFNRCDDGGGDISDIFYEACADLGDIAQRAKPAPDLLARQVFEALQQDNFSQYKGLIAIMAPALGPEGLEHLKKLLKKLGNTPPFIPPKAEWEIIGVGFGGPLYAHEIKNRRYKSLVTTALQDIADAQGDVDGFIAQYAPKTRKVPAIASEIARRLLAAGRVQEAFDMIEQADIKNSPHANHEWKNIRLQVLEALGRKDEAQAFRLACFEKDLTVNYLRDYLKRLPDFDDIAAEKQAMAYAAAYHDVIYALGFFLKWPAPDHIAQLIMDRHDEIDGNYYEYLVPAADYLAANHPLAATLALRAMIDFALVKARSKRYAYAAKHLAACGEFAAKIDNFTHFEPHDAYLARLKAEHGKKYGFWELVTQ